MAHQSVGQRITSVKGTTASDFFSYDIIEL